MSDQETEAHRFGRITRRVVLISTALSLAVPALLWLLGVSAWLWAQFEGLPPWFATPLYALAVVLLLALPLLPVGFVGSHRVARRFDLSRQTDAAWLADWAKGTALGVVLGAAAVSVFYLCLGAFGPWWWLPYAALVAAGLLILVFLLPYVVLPLFFRLRPVQDEALVGRIRALFERARARLAAVVTLDYSAKGRRANAAVVGLGRSRRVVLFDTLLAAFEADEIEGVVAHELGHHVLGHIRTLVAAQVLLAALGLALGALVGPPLLALLGATLADRVALPLLLLGVEAYFLLLLPVTSGLSRALEWEADRFSWRLTGRPQSLAAALERLGRVNLVESSPPRWSVILLGTHPPLGERVRAARLAGGAGA